MPRHAWLREFLAVPLELDADGAGVRAPPFVAGYAHTCALLETGAVRCWGQGEYGRLGYGHANDIGDDETPASAGDVPYR